MTTLRSLVAASLSALLFLCASPAASAAGPRVALDTTMGRIVVELDPVNAPISSRNFMQYVSEGHYDGTLFHRVMVGFVIQGGGHLPDMSEKPPRAPIASEARNGLSNLAGTLAMAREVGIDTAAAQFFINVVDNTRLDHVEVPPEGVTVTRGGEDVFIAPAEADRVYGSAVFGRVVDGTDVVEKIRHVPVHTVTRGDDVFENVPVDPVVLIKAALLPSTH